MKREIKFRVWNGFEMTHDVIIGIFGAFYVNPSNNGLDPNDSASLTPFNTKYPDTFPVMQYTGLRDKKGVEIYEGDILEGHSDGNGLVVWSDYDGGYDYQFKDGEIVGIWEVRKHCIVIGNIHQKPELL